MTCPFANLPQSYAAPILAGQNDVEVRRASQAASRRRFVQVDPQGYPVGPVYKSNTPSSAAVKAAARGYRDIYLYDKDASRVYAYDGGTERIDPNRNAFTQRHGISQRAVARSRGYQDV